MAVRDYSGFQAIVNSVEKLRETVDREADKQLTIFRVIRDDQRLQLTALERMVEALKSRSQTRNNFGFPNRLELKNVRLETRHVSLSARSVIVETKGGLSREKQSKADSQEMAKALGSEIKKIKVGSGLGNPLQILGAGILLQFGFQIAKGIEKSLNKQFDFSFKGVGQVAGTAVTNPLQAAQDVVKMRRDSVLRRRSASMVKNIPLQKGIEIDREYNRYNTEVEKISKESDDAEKIAQMRKEAEKNHKEKLAEINKKYAEYETKIEGSTKPIVFAVGGFGGTGGRAGMFVKRTLQNTLGKKAANIESVENPETDPGFQELIDSLPEFIKNDPQFVKDVEKLKKKHFAPVLDSTADDPEISKLTKNILKALFSVDVGMKKATIWGRGYNPDAVKLAAKVADARKKNPNAPINLVGYSGGGFTVEEVLAILQEMGITDVQGTGIGTPDLGVGYKNNPNYQRVMGSTDYAGESVREMLRTEQATTTNVPGFSDTTNHQLYEYLAHPEVIKTLNEDLAMEAIVSAIQSRIQEIMPRVGMTANLVENLKDANMFKGDQEKAFKADYIDPLLQKIKEVNDYLNIFADKFPEKIAEAKKELEELSKPLNDALKKKVKKETKPNDQPNQVSTKQDIVETPDKVQQETKPNEPNQVPIKQDTPGRPDGSGNQPPDRNPDIVPVGPVELPIGSRNNVDIEANLPRGGGLAPLAGRLDTYQKTLKESLARVLDAEKVQTEIEIEPGFWVDVEQLNQGFVNKTQRRLILFWEKLRANLGKEINRTLAGLLGTIPGAMLGRGLTGDPVGGYLGGMAGRLIAETGFQDVSNFRSLQQQGMSPATAEFWQQFGNNRKFLPNTLRKTAVGYVTGSVVGRGINDVMQATGANQLIGALMPSWLETAIGDGINRTIKTIADPNIDLAIPNLPPAANKILSAPLHAVGKSVAAQGFLGNVATSFLDHQTKTALMPVREALTGVGQALGGEGLLGEYLGDRFTGLGIGAIQNTAKASGRGVAGMIAPGLPAEVRNFIADQVIKQGVLDGTVRDQVAPFLASRAGSDLFARGVKVPVTGKIAGTINQTLDKYDPFAIAPKQLLTDEQILLNREQRLAKKRTTAINAVENLFNRIDKSVDETTKAVVGIGNGFLGFFDNIRTKTYDFAKKTAGLTEEPVTLIDQYVVYLDQLVQDAQKQAEETVKGIIPDYKNLTIPERKEAIGSYKADVVKQIKEFRKAIKEGDSQLALEIGENVLTIIESTRKIYKDLLEAVPSDLSGTKSIEANQRYLTSVQTEVLKGQPKKAGSAKTGLIQLVGTETSEGFIKGIEERLNKVRNSGKELAESAIEGAKKRLGIASPSKEFEKLGESSGQGYEIGIEKSLDSAKSAINKKIQEILDMDFYHGTSKAGAKSIRQQGIDVDKVQDATYGKGFYLTDKLGEAESYASEHRRPAVLKARLNVKNPFIVTEKGYQNFIKHAQKRGELPDPFSQEDPTGEKYQQYHRDKTKLLQKKGYDSIFVRDKGFAVAFEAEQVKLEESGKNAIESMIASIKKLLGKLFGLGKKAGGSLKEGIDESLKIKSPSQEMKDRGESVGQGFKIGTVESLKDASKAILAEIEAIKAEVAKELKGIVKPSKLDKFLADGSSKALSNKGLDAVIYRLNNSFNLKPEHQKIVDKLALYGRTQKPSIIRMHGSDQKHKIGESVEFPSATSFTGKVDQVKKTGSLSYLKLQPGGSLYEVVNPRRGFDVPYDNSYTAPFAEEDETIASGKYKVVGKKQKTISVDYGEKDGIEKLKVTIYQLEEIRSEIDKSISLLSKPVAQLKSAFDNLGKDTIDGFIKGVQGNQSDAIEVIAELVDSVIEKAKNDLEIQSPSKVFKKIGTWVVEGFNQGIDKIKNYEGVFVEIQDLRNELKELNTQAEQAYYSEVLAEVDSLRNEIKNLQIEAESVLPPPTAVDKIFDSVEKTVQATNNKVKQAVDNLQQYFNDFYNDLIANFPVINQFKDVLLGFIASLALGNVFEFLASQLTALGTASFDAVLELESLRLALTSVTGSAEAGAKGLAFVREEAQRLGVELKTAEEAYTGFLAVTKYTVLQGNQADRIFSAFQETAARRGLSNEEQGRMFAAINQAISKRKLSAEEVRGQLGEIPGLAFESTVARSMGVNPAQLSEMMGDGLLMAEDVFPRVAALYEAENAKIAGATETTAQALTRFQNAIVNLQRSFEGWIAPAKTFFNFFATAIEKLSEMLPNVVRYLTTFWVALYIDLGKITIGLAKFLVGLKTVQAVLFVLGRIAVAAFKLIYKELLIFLKQFALLTLAVDALGAVIYILSNNAFPELKKGIEEATDRANQLEQALQNVGKATQAIPRELPKTEEEIVTNRTWNILGWDTGFNLEGTRQFLNNIDKAVGFEALGFEPMLTTLGQQELGNFQENVGGLLSQVDKNLFKQFDVEKTIKEIRELDKELTQARSRQFNIPAGDKKRYEAAIKEQQKLIEERDKKLSVTASFEKALQGDKAEIEEYLKALDELVAKRGITEDAEKSIRAQLEQRLKDIDKTSTAFDDLMSNLQKSVNALTLALRNLNEQAAYFNETLQRNATNARVQFMRRARAAGLGSQARDLGLDEIEQNTLEARIVFLRDQLGAVNELLTKPDFADLLTELRQQAADMGVNLENTATIDRLISENRSQQETAVLNTLKEQLRLQDELGQAEENLEQSISSTRSAITDLNNSVEEFFFNLTQRIDEAIVEVDRILNKLKYTDIKNRLQRALVPGSNTFVNGLVGQIQGIFDRASGIVEQLLGQRSARINFVGERRGLQVELENFTRNLGGATEALELFRQGLLGNSGQESTLPPSGSLLPVPKPFRAGKGELPPPPSSNLNIGSNPFNPLFELLFKGEGNENSVNRGRAGDTPNGLRSLFGKDAAQFTVGEIMRLQQQRRIFAVGMPQFIPSTLRNAVENSGISLDTPFNLQTQQKLAIELLKNKRPEIWRYLTGKSDNLIEAAQGMAREWAAIGLSYPEAGRGVGVSRYAGTAGNAASISPAQVQRALQETKRNLGGKTPNPQPLTPTLPTALIPNVNNAAAEGLTNRLIQIKENQVNLGDAGVRQEIEAFFIQLQQTQQEILRQLDDSIRESTQSIINTRNNLEDIFKQYSPQTQSAQLETELRGVENQFRDLDNQLFEQERGLTDNIQGLDKLLGQMKPILEILSTSTNQVDQESASFLMGLIGRLEQDKATYSGMRTEIQQLRGQLKEGKLDAENFVRAQAKLRTIQSDLERIGTELAIAQEQNNLEQERAIALLQSRQQLELDLLQIAQDFEDEDRDKRLALAKEQARLREREIEYQFQSKTLSQETELISQRLAIAQSLSNLGKINELELLQSQKQLEQEILEIKKQYPDLADQERRINLAKEQARLREIGIENNYNNQRWQRQQELFDMESRIVEARAARLERFGQPFEAAAMREELAFRAELLRYEQEIEAIRQRYTDPADEQTRDELIRNAGILLELNLEQIDQQFKDLGETIRDTASGAFATFLEDTLTGTKSIGDAFLDMAQSILKSLAQIAARMAIGGLFRLLKIPVPGFADGGTVPNFAEGDTVKSAKFANFPFKGIHEALRKEGSQGVLAVFTPGEEILSLRTGEAQRYQRLKAQLGKNPLAKIGNFADGGTIGINENLLAGLNYGMPTAGRLPNNFGQTTQVSNYGGDRSVTVNVTAPNPSAFNASERQIGRTIAEYLSRV